MFFNHWSAKRFLTVILSIQAILLILIALDFMGLSLPFLRQAIGFIYLTFIPGILILKSFRFIKLTLLETILYSVGLSLFLLMFTGLFLQVILPLVGISQPLSSLPVIISLAVLVLVLSITAYKRGWESVASDVASRDKISFIRFIPVLFLILLVLFSILGAQQAATDKVSTILLFVTAAIALIAVASAFGKLIPKELYPLVIFAISLALLYQVSMMGSHLSGYGDIQAEYYFYNSTLAQSSWDMTIHDNLNAMLSVVILPGMYTLVANIDGFAFYKVLYPLLFSLMPVALYLAYKKILGDERGAFLGAFFFMAFYGFFRSMPFLPRQGIAELFIALLFLVILSREMTPLLKTSLAIVFAIGIVVSHYSVTYLCLFLIPVAWLAMTVWQGLRGKPRANSGSDNTNPQPFVSSLPSRRIITGGFTILFVTFGLAWLMYMSDASAIGSVARIGQRVGTNFFAELLNPGARGGASTLLALGIGPGAVNWLHQASRYIYYATELFITVGIVKLILSRKERRANAEYLGLAIGAMFLLSACVVVPYLTESMVTSRIFHIALIFLAPLCILGGRTVFAGILQFNQVFHKARRGFTRGSQVPRQVLREGKTKGAVDVLLTTVLIAYFLFNANLPYILTGEIGKLPLCTTNLQKYGNDEAKAHIYSSFGYAFEQDALGAQWLTNNITSDSRVYADRIARETILLSEAPGLRSNINTLSPEEPVKKDSYIYLRYVNTRYGFVAYPGEEREWFHLVPTSELYPSLDRGNKVYSNGSSEIYYSP